ncbi:MAG: XkdX family protein [Lachnospiraceae bacterium]|nr:XkdX family protein [Lachnospiraceae bacterium]
MYEILKRLYVAGKLSDAGLSNAVIKGWITESQRKEIIAAKKKR